MTDLFDHYSYRARLQPALLTLVPVALAALTWAPPGARWLTTLWSLLGVVGFTVFLANVARNRGKRLEPELWKSWGGSPSTQLLRHSGPGNSVLRDRWHKQLSKLLGKALPTAVQEQANPADADEVYEAVTRLLIGKTRDTKSYPLVYKENVSYGFCRNLFGLRGLGKTVASMGAIASIGAGAWHMKSGDGDMLPWACAVVCASLAMWWFFTVTSEWVKVPATNYAQHLFECCEKLNRTRKEPEKSDS